MFHEKVCCPVQIPLQYRVTRAFFVVGPTATGKSELAADVAARLGAEIVSADAFQIYEGFDVLSGKPDQLTLRKVPHHLIGAVARNEEMSAMKYRALTLPMIAAIVARGKLPLVVGGSGLYVKALTHGLADVPPSNPTLRAELDALSTEELRGRLTTIDPVSVRQIDVKNRRRLVRAVEIAVLSGKPASEQRREWGAKRPRSGDFPIAESAVSRRTGDRRSLGREDRRADEMKYSGIFVFRDRDELYQRINERVETMFANDAVDEVRDAGRLSSTVEQMIGVSDIRRYLSGEISRSESVTRIQQATRRYAKRQLTWFRHQTKFEALNLSLLSHNEAVLWVLRRAIAWRAVND
jgi:tRNA dimethylallyltransferase